MEKPKHKIELEQLSQEDQSKAYLFVGRFICDFATLESKINYTIKFYLTIDITLNAKRKEEIFDKNRSITSIMEYSVLGSPYFNFQMKNTMLKAIIQERTPKLFIQYGKRMFNLISKIQDMRNLIAHHKTYVYEGDILIAKPLAKFKTKKGNTQKGGIIPEPIGKYETVYKQDILTAQIKDKIAEQISIIGLILNYYTFSQDTLLPKETTHSTLESLLNRDDLYEGGVYDISILN